LECCTDCSVVVAAKKWKNIQEKKTGFHPIERVFK
jgi:hypothetical protein